MRRYATPALYASGQTKKAFSCILSLRRFMPSLIGNVRDELSHLLGLANPVEIMARAVSSSPSNLLLAAFPSKDHLRLLARAKTVTLRRGAVLFDRGDRVGYVYFPNGGALSMMATADDHSTLQISMVGSEGVCGFSEILSGQIASLRALVIDDCEATRISSADFLRLVVTSANVGAVMAKYVAVRFAQLAQTVACTRFHVLEQRFARWLLMVTDRVSSADFMATHELISRSLGVRRVGISGAAAMFKKKGLIDYSRGRLEIVDRIALERESCACYQADRRFYQDGMSRQTRVGQAVTRQQ